jgi:putative membrane protein
MNFLKVAGRDISSIFKNRFIRVSVIAIIIVPLLYSLLYLDAFWDPYTRIKDMPVAVVNLDKGSTKDGEKVNYGQNLVNNLKEKEEVGWRFVTKQQAEEGVKGKDYYAMFVIPEDFSENALSATKGKPVQAKILYSANEKKNFLAAQINGKVLDQLKSELTKNMSNGYVEVVFDSLYEIKDGMRQASEGSKELADGLVTAKDGTSKLKDGAGELNSSVPEMMDGVGELLAGSNTLTSKLWELNDQVPTMVSGVSQLRSGADQLGNGLSQLNEAYKTQIVPSTGKLKDGAAELALGLGAAKEGVAQLSGAAVILNDGGELLTEGSAKLDAGYSKMKPGIIALKDGSAKVAGGVDVLLDNSKKSQAVLKHGVDGQLGAYLNAHPEAMNDPNMQGFLATLDALNSVSTDEKNLAMMTELQTGAHKVSAGAGQLEQGSTTFVDGSQKFAQSAVAFASGTEQFSKGAGNFAEKTGTAVVAANQISDGLDKLYTAMNGEFGNGLSQLNDKAPALTGGLSEFNEKMPALADGTSKLSEGSAQLTAGISTLNGKLPKLKDGVNKLYDGANKLDDGTIKLSDGSKELNEKLAEGYNDLGSSLKNDSKTMAATFSEPVVIDQKPINAVKTYGEGFTPYFIPLSLWVGALMMFFVITDKVDSDIEASPAAVVAGKFMSYGVIGFMQATLASGAVILLGLRPDNVILYFLFNIFLSFVFIAIIQCMVFLLGQVGRLISIILLILQLTSCAGTFPIEVVPKLFRVLNPFMPFTYAVSGIRGVVSGLDYAVFAKDVTVLAAMLFVFLFISIVMKGHADKVQKIVQDRKEQAAI